MTDGANDRAGTTEVCGADTGLAGGGAIPKIPELLTGGAGRGLEIPAD